MDLGDGAASVYTFNDYSSACGRSDWQASSHIGVVDGLGINSQQQGGMTIISRYGERDVAVGSACVHSRVTVLVLSLSDFQFA